MESERNSRMDTGELKAQLFKKVGQERFKKYFYSLNRFINQKLSKSEFDKSCYRILGRENLPLHNQIIKAILKNACSSKTRPQAHEVGSVNKARIVDRSSPILEDGHGQGVTGSTAQHHSSVAPNWSNGVGPMSPRKGRSTIRDRKLRDRPSPLGPNGKADSTSHHSTTTHIGAMSLENGDIAPCDYQRSLLENDERLMIKKRADASHVENGEEVVHTRQSKISNSPLIAPLGIPFCSASTGGARKALPVTHIGDYVSCFDLDALTDSETLRGRMEQIASTQGLGVTLECANTFNNMVDVYVKGLIRSCLELVGSRSASDTSTYLVQKQQMPRKPINGHWPSNPLHMHNTAVNQSVSMLDFKVAMELNPQQLGENWPLLLEIISMQGFDE